MTEKSFEAQLAECRRNSDNHRRSRDYHKEAAAVLRKDNEGQKLAKEFWMKQHELMDEAYQEAKRHHEAWMTLAIALGFFAIGMSVLFFWAVRK
jgi:hypothetical protein